MNNMDSTTNRNLTDEDVNRIAEAVANRSCTAFRIDEETHYNQHKRIDELLDAYVNAKNLFWKTFLSIAIIGVIVIAGLTASKGVR